MLVHSAECLIYQFTKSHYLLPRVVTPNLNNIYFFKMFWSLSGFFHTAEKVKGDGCCQFIASFSTIMHLPHYKKKVQEWCEEHDKSSRSGFVLQISQISIWDVLDQQIWPMEARPHSLHELKDLLLMSWCQKPQDTFRGLVESKASAHHSCSSSTRGVCTILGSWF